MNLLLLCILILIELNLIKIFKSEIHHDAISVINSNIYPVCANVTWKAKNPDIRSTLYDCVENIADAYNIPGYLNGSKPTPVRVAYAFNNLISISEIESTVTIDFFFRNFWMDQRLNMPELWSALSKTKPTLLIDGIELTTFIRDPTDPLRIWLPDLYFANGNDYYSTAETIRLRPGGIIFWSRHMVAVFQQSLFSKKILF